MRLDMNSVLYEVNALIANLTRLRLYAQRNAANAKNFDAYTQGFFDGKQEGLRIAAKRAIEVMERIEPDNG